MIDVSIEPRQLASEHENELGVRFTNGGTGTYTDIVFKLGLPPQILLLRGRYRMEIPELSPGSSCLQSVTVRPRQPGEFAITSPNFSYRNEYGTPVRVSAFQSAVEVLAALPRQQTQPDLTVTMVSGPLTIGEWDVLRLLIHNSGFSDLRDLHLAIGGPVRIAPPGPDAHVRDLPAGQGTEVSFITCPAAGGRGVPAQVHISYVDGSGRSRVQNEVVPLTVGSVPSGHHSAVGQPKSSPATILYLTASPQDLPPLRSDKEMREIDDQMRLGKDRDYFRLVSAHAARFKDIGQKLADHDPRVVHFSGHGRTDGSLYVEDESGFKVAISAAGLAGLFSRHARTIDCVIVNACHTLRLAEAIAAHIDHVIGMRYAIGDTAAISFSIGFYQGLASGAPVQEAFKRGRDFVLAPADAKPEGDVPVLLGRGAKVLA